MLSTSSAWRFAAVWSAPPPVGAGVVGDPAPPPATRSMSTRRDCPVGDVCFLAEPDRGRRLLAAEPGARPGKRVEEETSTSWPSWIAAMASIASPPGVHARRAHCRMSSLLVASSRSCCIESGTSMILGTVAGPSWLPATLTVIRSRFPEGVIIAIPAAE